ncbi:unnamed protein product, partial [marine sediment metagenome]
SLRIDEGSSDGSISSAKMMDAKGKTTTISKMTLLSFVRFD